MTVEATNTQDGPLLPNGATTSFPFTFKALTADEVAVALFDADGEAVTPGTFEATIDPDGGGTVEFDVAPDDGLALYIYSDPDYEQTAAFANQLAFLPAILNNAFDRDVVRSLANRALINRSLIMPIGDAGFTFPGAAERANKSIGFGPDGSVLLGGSTGGGSQGDPGGNVESIGLFTAASALTIEEGTDRVTTSGYSEPGVGPAVYIADEDVDAAYVTAYPRAAFMTDNDRGFRLLGEQNINVFMFGAVADDSTDNLTAFNAALAYLKKLAYTTGDFRATPALHIPIGKFYLSSTWNIHQTLYIRGAGSGQPNAVGTFLRFGNNCNCIVLHDWRSTDADGGGAGSAGLGDSSGSVIEGINVWGGNAGSIAGPYSQGDSTTGNGIRIRSTAVVLRDVFVAFCGEDGININASAGTTGATQGNANSFYLERVWCAYNGRYGVLINGTDVNAGTTLNLSVVSNGAGGLMDYSFLGNTHIMTHTRDNCIFDPTGGGNPTSTCKYSGAYYYVVAGQHAAASTTEPGTNSAVWAVWGGSASSRTWVSGMTWQSGSPYGTNPSNTNARNVFICPYAEGTQPPAQATSPSIFVGGLLDEIGVVGSATWLRGNAASGLSTGSFITVGTNRNIQFGSPTGDQLQYFSAGSPVHDYRWMFNDSGKQLILQAANSATWESWGLNGTTSGYGAGHHFISRLFVGHSGGNASNGVFVGCTSSLAGLLSDQSGATVAAGWTWLYSAPVLGGAQGVVCKTGGTIGGTAVLAEFGYVELEGTATYDPPNLVAVGDKTTIQTMTVTGAALGDMVEASFSVSLAGARIFAWVSAANTVSYYFVNENGGANLDLGSGTVRARVIK